MAEPAKRLATSRGGSRGPPVGPAPRKPFVILSRGEVAALLMACRHSERDHALFSTLYYTGCRVSEAAGMTVGNLDPARGVLTFWRKKVRSWHSVPVVAALETALRRMLGARRLRGTVGPDAPMFESRQGGGISVRQAQRLMTGYCKDAGIPREKAHPHIWRHTCAARIIESSRDVFAVQTVLGHRSLESSRAYLHADQNYARDALSGL